ncbi:Secreted protein OS=Streptomyces fumanus OX=67302 GN=GCM10018772_06720 PE=4 SV=1 [Streptomyces fumanus]
MDVRKQRAVTRRQLDRLTRIEEIADALPEGTCFAPDRPAEELAAAVEAVPATYAPECLSACELAFHCRARSRAAGAVTTLGRSARAELGGLATVDQVLAAAHGEAGDPADPAVAALRRAAALRAEALDALETPCS